MSLQRCLLIGLLFLPLLTFADADRRKGQLAYFKSCKKCHGNGTKGAVMNSQEVWNELFEHEGLALRQRHEKTKAKRYFSSHTFREKAPYLNAFLYYYASDSGNIPACD